VNHTRFPKEDQLPDWARRDNKVTKGDGAEDECSSHPSSLNLPSREIAPEPVWRILEKQEVSCAWQYLNVKRSSPFPSQYTDYATLVPRQYGLLTVIK